MTQNLDRFKFRVWDKEFQTMLIRKKHFLNSFGIFLKVKSQRYLRYTVKIYPPI